MEISEYLDGAVIDEIPVPFHSDTRGFGWMRVALGIDVDSTFHTNGHGGERVEQFHEFAVRDGGAAM